MNPRPPLEDRRRPGLFELAVLGLIDNLTPLYPNSSERHRGPYYHFMTRGRWIHRVGPALLSLAVVGGIALVAGVALDGVDLSFWLRSVFMLAGMTLAHPVVAFGLAAQRVRNDRLRRALEPLWMTSRAADELYPDYLTALLYRAIGPVLAYPALGVALRVAYEFLPTTSPASIVTLTIRCAMITLFYSIIVIMTFHATIAGLHAGLRARGLASLLKSATSYACVYLQVMACLLAIAVFTCLFGLLMFQAVVEQGRRRAEELRPEFMRLVCG